MQSQSEIKIPGHYGISIIADPDSDKDPNEAAEPVSSRFDPKLLEKENEIPKDQGSKSDIKGGPSEEGLRPESVIEEPEDCGFPGAKLRPKSVIKGPEDWCFPEEGLRPESVIEEPEDCGFPEEKLPSKSDIKEAEYLTSSKKESEENAKKLMRPAVLQSIIDFMSFIGGLLEKFYNLITMLFRRDGGIHRD